MPIGNGNEMAFIERGKGVPYELQNDRDKSTFTIVKDAQLKKVLRQGFSYSCISVAQITIK